MKHEAKLQALRNVVERVTLEIIHLASRRASIVKQIAELKSQEGFPIEDPRVERELTGKVLEACEEYGLDRQLGIQLLSLLVRDSIRLQRERLGKLLSPISIFSDAKALEREGKKIIHLEVGEPDFPPPSPVISEAIRSMRAREAHYAEPQGIHELRDAIARHINERFRADVKGKQVIVTPGARFALYISIASYIAPGDEVIMFQPMWPAAKQCVEQVGGRAIVLRTHLEHGWTPSVDELSVAMSEATKMIVLNYPNNPTGKILEESVLRSIIDVARDNNIAVLSDEVYLDYAFNNFKSILQFPDCRYIFISSFSKSYAMTGFRIGYAISDEEIISRLTKLQALSLTSVAEFVQRAAVKALEAEDYVQKNVRIIKQRIKVASKELKKLPMSVYPPDGGLYLFPKVELEEFESQRFASELLKNHSVAISPGTIFGDYPRHIRLSLCQPEQILLEGMTRLGEMLR